MALAIIVTLLLATVTKRQSHAVNFGNTCNETTHSNDSTKLNYSPPGIGQERHLPADR